MTTPPTNFKHNHRLLGAKAETLALKYLINKGFSFINRNYTIRGGEIDLIMQKNGIIYFVEVKARWHTKFGTAFQSLTATKKRHILRTIFTYLESNQIRSKWQADLIAIDFLLPNKAQIAHISNIFLV